MADEPVVVLRYTVEDGSIRALDHVSPNIESVLGHPREGALHLDFWRSILHPDDRARAIASIMNAVEDHRWPLRLTHRLRCADGGYRHFQTILDQQTASSASYVGYLTDVTDQHDANQQVRERERRLTAMFDGAPAQMYVKDLEGRYLLCNREVLDIWNLSAEDVIGKTDRELWPEFADTYAANDRHVAELGSPVVCDEVATVAGVQRTYLSLKFPLRDEDGAVYATAGVSEDISDRARDADDLRVAKDAADRANAAKGEFLSRMSHELRTPLNSVLGFGQLLEMSGLEGEDEDYVHQILNAGRHLLDLINEVLDIARIESGRLEVSIEPVDVADVVGEASALLRPFADERSIDFSISPGGADGFVAADRQRLLQVMLNLISNATKYNRQSGAVHIQCSTSVDDWIRIEVRDTGRGISPENQELVFDAFERLDAGTTGIEGTGVGLTLSKYLVEHMGGRMGVESELGVGSTFWVDLPVAIPPETHHTLSVDGGESPDASPSGVGTIQVLCIEDNLANISLIEKIVALRPGVRLLTALHGALGIELAAKHRPDVILLDLHLPDIPGTEILQRLRADPITGNIPVIVVSADATQRQHSRLLAQGASGYLTKPIDIKEVLDLIDSIGAPKPPG